MERIKRLHLELLLNREVRDSAGKKVGRIEEVLVESHGGQCRVLAYLLGPGALFRRLSIPGFAAGLLHVLGGLSYDLTYRVPWQDMDLSDPKHPRLHLRKQELQEIRDGP